MFLIGDALTLVLKYCLVASQEGSRLRNDKGLGGGGVINLLSAVHCLRWLIIAEHAIVAHSASFSHLLMDPSSFVITNPKIANRFCIVQALGKFPLTDNSCRLAQRNHGYGTPS